MTSLDKSDSPLTFLTIRLIMQGKEVGSIIGKKGEIVKRFREESGAKINISDGSCPERIVSVTGSSDSIYQAFTLICSKFEEDLIQVVSPGTVPCPPITFRLIVPASQCGSLIGKGGSKIKEIRELTGASIQVASEMLPNSTERAVTISGNGEAITQCIYNICNIMAETPPKGPTIPYKPQPFVVPPSADPASESDPPSHQPSPLPMSHQGSYVSSNSCTPSPCPIQLESIQILPQVYHPAGQMSPMMSTGMPPPIPFPPMGVPYVRLPPLPPMTMPLSPQNGDPTFKTGLQQHVPMYPPFPEFTKPGPLPVNGFPNMGPAGMAPAMINPAALAALTGNSGRQQNSHQNHEMTVPNELIGCIIGKGGSKIAEIRQISGAMIRISNCEDRDAAPNLDRTITITGNCESVALAQYLINMSMELHKANLLNFGTDQSYFPVPAPPSIPRVHPARPRLPAPSNGPHVPPGHLLVAPELTLVPTMVSQPNLNGDCVNGRPRRIPIHIA